MDCEYHPQLLARPTMLYRPVLAPAAMQPHSQQEHAHTAFKHAHGPPSMTRGTQMALRHEHRRMRCRHTHIAHKHQHGQPCLRPSAQLIQHRIQGLHRQAAARLPEVPCGRPGVHTRTRLCGVQQRIMHSSSSPA